MATRRSFLTNLGIVTALGGGMWLARDKLLWPAPRPRLDNPTGAWLPFVRPDEALITVLAGIGGTVVTALVDSGAQYTSIDRALVKRLGLDRGLQIPMVAMGVGGAGQVAMGVSIDLELGGARIESLRAAAMDLGAVSRALGQDVPLIIGFDLLSALVLEVDYPGRQMRLGDPARYQDPAGGLEAPVRKAGRALVAKVAINDTPLELMVDTGATGFVGLSAAAARQAGLTDQSGHQSQSVVLGGVADSRVVEAQRLTFAGETFTDVEVQIIDMPSVPGFPKGLLGVDAFSGHRVVIDAGAGRMRLYPV